MRHALLALAFVPVVLSLGACKTGPAEPEPAEKEPTQKQPATTATQPAPTATPTPAPTPVPPPTASQALPSEPEKVPVSPDDPLKGQFSLADATKGLKGTGAIVAKIDTSKGTFQCKLFDDKAPNTVANFIGLATGKRTWKDGKTQKWVNKPAYDGTTFHRIIKGFMIQGGDSLGNGTGEPGYVIADEIWPGAKHDRPGLLSMANRGPNTNGAQFFITDAAADHLDRPGRNGKPTYTIFGECAPVELVHTIAGVATAPGDKPTEQITIKSVTISRDDKKK